MGYNKIKEWKRCKRRMIIKDGPVGFVDVGLHPTPVLRIVKRPVGMINAKGNGIERSVQNGIRKYSTMYWLSCTP